MSAAVTKVGANIIPKQDPKAHATHQPHCSSAKRGECNPLAGSLQTNDQPCRLYSLQILQALGGYALVHPQHSQPLHTRSTQSCHSRYYSATDRNNVSCAQGSPARVSHNQWGRPGAVCVMLYVPPLPAQPCLG
jgi:hypothetical protein